MQARSYPLRRAGESPAGKAAEARKIFYTEGYGARREFELARPRRSVARLSRRFRHSRRHGVSLYGNSLGLLNIAAARACRTVEEEWGGSAISGWNDHHWIDLPLRVGSSIAKLIDAGDDEVVAGDTTSVNLFKCLAAALSLRPGRRAIR